MEAEVLAWLATCEREDVLFSDVTRALITNRAQRRLRSRDARQELREVLARLEGRGVVELRATGTSGRGIRGLTIHLVQTRPLEPMDRSTLGEAS